MRPLPILILSTLLCCSPALADTSPFTLRTVLIDGETELFSIANTTGSSRWLKLGDSYEGWKATDYDDARKVLTLTRDSQKLELSLATALITDSTARPGNLAEAEALLQKMRFEEMIGKSIESQQAAMAKSMGQLLGENLSESERGEFVALQAKIMKVMIDEMDLPGMRKDLAQIYADTFSQSELGAMSDFYSTPAGTAMLEKQPVLQQRMTELMMPRMMKAMPKIQQMARDYAAEKAAPAAEQAK